MSECCGESRESLFCPDCGRELSCASALVSLLAHIELQMAANERRKRLCERVIKSSCDERQLDKASRRLPVKSKNVAKWESWRDAVAAAIAKANQS